MFYRSNFTGFFNCMLSSFNSHFSLFAIIHYNEKKPVKLPSSILLRNAMPLYYTIIDFNEVDIRIYRPEKIIFIGGCKTEVNITFKGE